jgi:hypothetical protein
MAQLVWPTPVAGSDSRMVQRALSWSGMRLGVISATDAFEIAKEMIRRNPKIKEPRGLVVS